MEFGLQGPFQVAHTIRIGISDCSIPIDLLPKQQITGDIITPRKELRCNIRYGKTANRGGYGSIRSATRTTGNSTGIVAVKCPHQTDYSLCPEAILQWMASQHLRQAGILGAVPHVYDIFQYAGESRFSMDFIPGYSAIDAIVSAPDPDTLWLQILAQVSLLLGFLEETMRLDHRDLKADNLWICRRPVEYSLTVGGIPWRLKAPFQVVILDFGFACIGDSTGNAVVSLSDGIVPKIDPCPKEGRDLFQLIASMWSVPNVRARASKEIQIIMEGLLAYGTTTYVDLIRRTAASHWIYMAVSDSSFRHPPLHPLELLIKLSRDWPCTDLHRE